MLLRLCSKADVELAPASTAVGATVGAAAVAGTVADIADLVDSAAAAAAAALAVSLPVSSRARRGGKAPRELIAERRCRISREM